MYTTSEGYKKANAEPVRRFESNILIGDRKLTNEDLISLTIEQSIQQDDTFTIGNTIASCLNLVFLHNDTDVDDKDVVDIRLGLLVNELYEYMPLGIYNIYSIDSNDSTTTLVCYDNMIKFDIEYTENNENPTLYSVINRLIEITGVNFAGNLLDYKDYKLIKLQGYSCREVLGFIAGVLSSNSIIDRTGKFNFVPLSINPICEIERMELIAKDGHLIATKDNEIIEVNAQIELVNTDRYYDYTKKNKRYKITKIVNVTDMEELSIGSVDDNSVLLLMQNPFVTQNILQDIYSTINGLEYLAYSLSWNGDLSIDLGDLISIIDSKGIVRTHPILSQTITYNGALSVMCNAQGDTKAANTYNAKNKEDMKLSRTITYLDEAINEVNSVKAELIKMQELMELMINLNMQLINTQRGDKNE